MQASTTYSGVERRIGNSMGYLGGERRAEVWRASSPPDDRSAVLRAIARDGDAFTRLYDRFVVTIYRYVYYQVGDDSLARTLTERIFVTAWEKLPAFPNHGMEFREWLLALAAEQVANEPEVHPAHVTQQTSRQTVDRTNRVREFASPRDLNAALAQLSSSERQVIVLRLVHKLSVEQISRLAHMSPENVRRLQYRALDRLGGKQE